LATIPVETPSPKMYCGECGGSYPVQELVRFGNQFVCVNCKPGYVQRLREGVHPVGSSLAGAQYGGFWIRALALFIDGLITGIVTVPIFLVIGFSFGGFRSYDASNPPPIGAFMLGYLVILALYFTYNVWFVSQKGGTPGKLVLGLRIVTLDGHNLTPARAIGRYFALMLSGFTFYIGFIIAGFDPEKRALHDYICGTRVIIRR
jgi:uncharacterized RDD family membrane protein YckC